MYRSLKVSVVTPSLNSARFLESAIHSVMDQDYPNVEHIIVDGGSNDGTLEILQEHPHLHWISEPDDGQSEALNKGFRMAQGEILCWLNADDSLADDRAITSAATMFESDPHVNVIYGDFNIVDQDDRVIEVMVTKEFDLVDQLMSNLVSSTAVFIRRAVLERVGYLD
ncbi:MAG: glycosyltransferase, partial [Chloroflexi bacterium]|nr:glycosyltransferase [Chloroflexota bacterium]